MAHVNKGLIGFKIDGTKKAIMENCFVQRSMNLGGPGSPLCGAYYNVSVPGSMHPGYNGANTRGFSVAGSRSVILRRCEVSSLMSTGGTTVGFDVHTDSRNVRLKSCRGVNVESLAAGGQSSLSAMDAVVVYLGSETRKIKVCGQCFDDPKAPGGISAKVVNEGNLNSIGKESSKCPFMN